MFLTAEPLLQQLYSRVIRIDISDELFKAFNVLIQILSIEVDLASANQKHVFNCLDFFVCELTRSAPRKFFKFFLKNVDFLVSLLDEFEIGL